MSEVPATGRVDVIMGPMFAGKTDELLRRVRRAGIAGRRVEVVGHALDTRRGTGLVSSHSGAAIAACTARDAAELERLADPDVELLAIDEAQFFGPALTDVVQRLADRGTHVVLSGLCVTFDGEPFEPLGTLAALAESVTKLTAVCTVCGADAPFHTRTGPAGTDAGSAIPAAADAVPQHVGGTESYQARCRAHFPGAAWRSATR
ncbi:MAG: thymidine kinase [Cellulomonadaceae bacterium]